MGQTVFSHPSTSQSSQPRWPSRQLSSQMQHSSFEVSTVRVGGEAKKKEAKNYSLTFYDKKYNPPRDEKREAFSGKVIASLASPLGFLAHFSILVADRIARNKISRKFPPTSTVLKVRERFGFADFGVGRVPASDTSAARPHVIS